MFNFWHISKKNRKTFYNYRTGKQLSVFPRLLLMCILSVLLAYFLFKPTDDFLNGILTVQSILVGFSFSVLFFLISNDKYLIKIDDAAEIKIRKERLNVISDELFYNISYFNFIAVMSVIVILLLLLPAIHIEKDNMVLQSIEPDLLETLKLIKVVLIKFARFILYILILESMFTFLRSVGRVSYYFGKKLELQSLIKT